MYIGMIQGKFKFMRLVWENHHFVYNILYCNTTKCESNLFNNLSQSNKSKIDNFRMVICF